jgi:hypothetical protein
LDYGRSLIQCQRYYFRIQSTGSNATFGSGFNFNTTLSIGYTAFPVVLRTAPAALEQSGTAANYGVYINGGTTNCSSVPVFNTADTLGATTQFTVASGLTSGQGAMIRANNSSAYLAWSAEL